MIPRLQRSWRLPLCLCCVSLSLTVLYLCTYNALAQIPPTYGYGYGYGYGDEPTVQFAYVEYYIAQNAGGVTIRVTLSAESSQTVTYACTAHGFVSMRTSVNSFSRQELRRMHMPWASKGHLPAADLLPGKDGNSAKVLLTLVCLSCSFGSGCDNSSDARTGAPSSVEQRLGTGSRYLVKSLPPVFDDGKRSREVVFPIRNDSSQTINIQRVDRSCSCSDAAMNLSTLAPGEQGELRFTLHHRGRVGPQRVSCAVIPDVGEPWRCEVVTHVYQRIRFEPQVINLGVVACSEQPMRRVTLEQRVPEGEPLPSIQDVSSEVEGLTVAVTGKEESKAPRDGIIERNTHLEVSVSPRKKTTGDYFGNVVAKYKGPDGQPQMIHLPISWRVPTVVETFPSRVLFGLVKKRAVTEKVIRVKRNDGGSLNDLEVAVEKSQGEITVSQTLSPDKKELMLGVRLNPSKVVADEIIAGLTIRVCGTDTGEVRVPIIASIGGD